MYFLIKVKRTFFQFSVSYNVIPVNLYSPNKY
ncbi:MAG: hypothetical protein IEMM0006_0207 [bacterium]|nr:MAG: hypothetical protein IEMM0006_0207 [bacterium]